MSRVKMSESNRDEDSETDYSGSDTEDTYDDDYNYIREDEDSREESEMEELVKNEKPRDRYSTPLQGAYSSIDPQLSAFHPPSEEDAPYCEREPSERGPRIRGSGEPVLYAPERGPPLLDFLFVLTAFLAAVFAAYYSMFTTM